MKSIILFVTFSIFIIRTDGIDFSLIDMGADYAFDAMKKKPIQRVTPPSNSNNSIQYLLYTSNNKHKACFIQPYVYLFDRCSFNSRYETKFLVHGFVSILTNENLFNDLKDAILKHGNYNVIIVNWTLYNTLPFKQAYRYAKSVGDKVAEMMRFIETYRKVSLKTVHCIGHSLGSHVCGVAGRNALLLGRITGLDPGGISKLNPFERDIRIRYTDGDFVDIMHTSDIFSVRGLGYLEPSGHLDYYPNGGVDQPACEKGNIYKVFKGKSVTVQTFLDKILCNHFAAIEYFTNSIKDDCKFIATKCESYSKFKKKDCSNITLEMGFHAKKIEGIPPKAKFYLKTSKYPPYCMG